MVVKTELHDRRSWWDPLNWLDGENAVGPRHLNTPINHNLPREPVLIKRIHTESDQTHHQRLEHAIIKARSYHVDQQLRMSKSFLEYCPFGDLKKLINEYRKAADGLPGNDTAGRARIPAPFIWYVRRS